MPIFPSQAVNNFGERYEWLDFVNATGNKAIGVNEIADRILITEIGIQAYNFAGTSLAMDVRRRSAHSAAQQSLGAAPPGFAIQIASPAANLLTAVGTSIWRPEGGILELISTFDDPLEAGIPLIQFQCRGVATSVTDWDGMMWMKWKVLSR